MTSVKDLFEIRKGKKAEETDLDSNARYIQIEDLRGDETLKYAVESKSNVLCTNSDVLIAWDGANAGTVGYGLEGIIGSTLAKLTPKIKNVIPDYAGRFLQSKFRYLRDNCTGATIPHISRPVLESLQIPLPPLAEQKKIAAILDAADELRQKDKALIAKYDELTQSLFLDMFGDIGSNVNNFSEYSVDDIATKVTDGDHLTPRREESGYKLLSCRNIRNGYIDFTAGVDYVGENEFQRMFKRCNPEKNDILISCSGTIGRTTTVIIDEPFVLVRSAALIKPKGEVVNSAYLEYYFRTKYMQALMKRSSNTSSQANLFTGRIKKLPVLLPQMFLQIQFADRAQAIESQKALAQECLLKSENLFNSLLQKAFKGELTN